MIYRHHGVWWYQCKDCNWIDKDDILQRLEQRVAKHRDGHDSGRIPKLKDDPRY